MKQLKIGIVAGATNEQGYLAIVQTINEPLFLELCTPILFGSTSAAAKAKELVQKDDERQILPANYIKDAKEAIDGRINIIAGCEDRSESLKATVMAYMNNSIDAIVIVPQDNKTGFEHKAVIEYVTKLLEFEASDVLTWKINGSVRVLNPDAMPDIPTVVKALRKDFLFIKPRIAVMSRDGSHHDQLKALREEGNMIFGPFDPNTVVEQETYKPYDCLVFPEKEMAVTQLFAKMDRSFTYFYLSGMPMVITAPVNNDNPCNIMQSIYAAINLTRARRKYLFATRSPLEKHWNPRGRDDYKLDLTKDSED